MCLVIFYVSLFLPLSFFRLVASWHLNENPLCPRTLSYVWFHDDKAQKKFSENFCRRGIQ